MNRNSQKSEHKIFEIENESTSTFDLEYLYNFSNGDQKFVNDMVQIFLKEIPIALEVLQTGIIEKDWKKVYNIAHRLTPNFMMLGMKKQQSQSETIEQMIKKDKIDLAKFDLLAKQIKEAVIVVFPLLVTKR